MIKLMLSLDAILARHRRVLLALWGTAVLIAVPMAARQSDHLTGGGFKVPGSGSALASEALQKDFPRVPTAKLAVVLVPVPGATAAALTAAVARVQDAAAHTRGASLSPAVGERSLALATRSPSQPVLIPLRVTTSLDASVDVAKSLRDRLDVTGTPRSGVAVHVVGQGALWAGLQTLSKKDLAKAEGTGFPIVLLILLAVFGSLAAAALPLALGVGSVIVSGALIWALSQTMQMSVFVTNMASMIGIGVAVDYSLFVLARYREEVLAGAEPDDARRTAMSSSGIAVVFSGLTVIVSLAGLWMINNTALRSMALGAILVVAVAVLASATLLPVMIGVMGRRAYKRSRWFVTAGLIAQSWARRRPGSTVPGAPPRQSFWLRWTAAVTRRPAVTATAAASVLLVLAIPVLSITLGNGALRQFPRGDETRTGIETAAAITGPGANSRIDVIVRPASGVATDAANVALAAGLARHVAADPAVLRVTAPRAAANGRSLAIGATPRDDGESDQAHALVRRLRAQLPTAAGTRASVLVGGTPAATLDFRRQVSGSMWKVILFVLGLSYVVLFVLLRSAVLPLKAVVMNLMSLGAAMGVLVAVFQWGWGGWLGIHAPGYVDVIDVPLVIAVVFGLSMDYEVFLLSRIRERFIATGNTQRAVAEGLGYTARTITSAALIMVAVFSVFASIGVPSIQELGLGNAVAIGIDATLVRLILVPATMELLGDWNWWLPSRLSRLLPRVAADGRVPAQAPAAG